jgi:hypothetical protein
MTRSEYKDFETSEMSHTGEYQIEQAGIIEFTEEHNPQLFQLNVGIKNAYLRDLPLTGGTSFVSAQKSLLRNYAGAAMI